MKKTESLFILSLKDNTLQSGAFVVYFRVYILITPPSSLQTFPYTPPYPPSNSVVHFSPITVASMYVYTHVYVMLPVCRLFVVVLRVSYVLILISM